MAQTQTPQDDNAEQLLIDKVWTDGSPLVLVCSQGCVQVTRM